MRTNRAVIAGTALPTRSFSPEAARGWGLAVVLAALLTLSACSTSGPADSNVRITSPTVSTSGQLSLHATATFTVSLHDPNGEYLPENLSYTWALDEERGTFLLDGGGEETEVTTTETSLRVRGDRAGVETVRVTVVDTSTDTTIGVGTLPFDITSPSDIPSLCFDSTTLFVHYSYPQNVDTIDLATGERTLLAAHFWGSDVSRDGNWVAGIKQRSNNNSEIVIIRCDRTGLRYLTDGSHQDYAPKFSPDGRLVYFLRVGIPDPSSDLPYSGYQELWVADLANGELTKVTHLMGESIFVGEFAISPDGQTIVIEYAVITKPPRGGNIIDASIGTIPAGGGALTTLMHLGHYSRVMDFDWSPDGNDIIFSARWGTPEGVVLGNGIYRIHPTAGSGPELVLPNPAPDSLPPRNPQYYAGGTRIAFDGRANGQNQDEVWSIDANGGDLTQMTSGLGEVAYTGLVGIWGP